MLKRLGTFTKRYLINCILVFVVFAALTGIAYPLAMTGVGQLAFKSKAHGSLVQSKGTTVGSALIGQAFYGPRYFHGRPSAAGTNGYDATASGATNLGPTNPDLVKQVAARVSAVRNENGLPPDARIPSDLVEASASGLDPDISPQSATLQARRIADARHVPERTILNLIKNHTMKRQFGILGEPRVNVLELNLALDRLSK